MPKKPETIFKEKVFKDLRLLRNSYFFKIQQMARVGDPDIVGTLNGHSIYLELKRSEKAKIDTLQVHNLHKAQAAGAYAFVAYPENWDKVYLFLKMLNGTVTKRMEIPTCLQLPSVI